MGESVVERVGAHVTMAALSSSTRASQLTHSEGGSIRQTMSHLSGLNLKGERTERDDLSYTDLHVCVACSHLVNECIEGCEDAIWREAVMPDLTENICEREFSELYTGGNQLHHLYPL